MRAVRCKLRPPQLNTNQNTARLETTRGFFRAFDKAGRPHPRKRRGIGPGHRRSSGVIAGHRHQSGNWHQPENRHLVGTNPRTGTWRAPTRELARAPTRELAPCGHQPENWWVAPGWGAIEIPRARRAPTRELALCGHQPENWHLVGANPRTGTWWAPTRELAPGGHQPKNRHLVGTNPRTGTWWAPTQELASGGHQPENWHLVGTSPRTGTWRATSPRTGGRPTRELAGRPRPRT